MCGMLARAGRSVAPLVLAALGMAGTAALGSGCQSVEKIEIPNIFRQVPERPLVDVPVPVGFRYKERGSYIFNSNFRVARLLYDGTPGRDDTVAFMAEQMPLSKWEALGRGEVGNATVLRFRNELEECTVTVDRHRGLTRLTIEIAPRED
ncbi:MAG: hypothetical protein KatS3mg102_0758 [Planctomycetota bacterium]|nr:MAG: hypothetical protein KatS3mg102_0758 [Planctomycetota bacterium]